MAWSVVEMILKRMSFRDEQGVTTVGMAVSMMVSLALLFSGAQLYRVQSASAEIQDVADVCALAAENDVAEFMVAANTCDAAVLSMTLLSATLTGIGVVCACVPALSGISADLFGYAEKVLNARNEFAETAASGLNSVQKVLPFLASANAARVAKANNSGAMQANYSAVAMLVSSEGVEITVGSDGLSDAVANAQANADELRDASAAAEEAAKEANAAKEAGYMYDCGADGSSMYERYKRFISEPISNPKYESSDAWSFKVALYRAKSYYTQRIQDNTPENDSVESKADAVLRDYFYRYAKDTVSSACAKALDDVVEFPELFHTLPTFRTTEQYKAKLFPITVSSEGVQVMHAMKQCPNASGSIGNGSVEDLERGNFGKCDLCKFEASSLANVASATTNTPSGFEYYYEHVRLAWLDYKEAMDTLSPLQEEVKNIASPILDSIAGVLGNVSAYRIHAQPPGTYGAIAIVVNSAQNSADTGFENAFVQSETALGTRVAISAATLLADTSDDGATVITSLLQDSAEGGGAAVGAIRIALDCWSGLLMAYQNGQAALNQSVKNATESLSTNTASGLGKWAVKALQNVVDAAGLESADLSVLKPVLLNSAYVVQGDAESTFSVEYLRIKSSALANSGSSTDAVSVVTNSVKGYLNDRISGVNEVAIATVELPFIGVSKNIAIKLPDSMASGAANLIDGALEKLGAAVSGVLGVSRSWQ
jgi:hypothetical protein